MSDFEKNTAESYDKVAGIYADKLSGELDYKPFDCKMLELFHERVGDSGQICDLGCGPGQIAGYLRQLGADTCGIDLSEEMIVQAKKLYPDIPFQAGNMLKLDAIEDEQFAGITAFYCIIHIPHEKVVTALKELHRVLKKGGHLFLKFHIGTEVKHVEEWFEQSVNVDFLFFEVSEMKDYLTQAGFTLTEVIEREPYPEEAQTRRAYIIACA